MGKTTILFTLLERYDCETETAFLFNTQCDTRDLLGGLARELRIESADQDLESVFSRFREFLVQHGTEKPVLLIIDEAQNLDESVLETVRLLSNFETPERKLLHIILSGQPELARKLRQPNLSQLAQRIMVVTRLRTLTPKETTEYIDYRLGVAGYKGPSLFSEDAVARVYLASRGVPRAINRLCFNALLLGAAENKRTIDARMIEEVVRDIDLSSTDNPTYYESDLGIRPSEPTPTPLRSSASRSTEAQPVRPNPPPPVFGSTAPDRFRIRKPDPSIARTSTSRPLERDDRDSSVAPQLRRNGGIANPAKAREASSSSRPDLSGTQKKTNLEAAGLNRPTQRGHQRQSNVQAVATSSTSQVKGRSLWPGQSPHNLQRSLIGVGLLLVIGAFAFSYLRGRSEIKAGDTSIAATETAASQQPRKEVVVSGKDDGVAVRSAAPAESSISGKGEHSTSKSKGSPNVTVATEVAQGDGLVPLPGDESLSQPVPLPLPSSAPRPLTFEDAEEHPPDVPTQPLEFSSALNLLAATASANSSLKPSLAQQPRPAILIARDVKPTQFVQPQYPGFARTAHIEGTVLLKATVSPSGKVSEVEVVKGPPALANAAVQAVKKWKYPAAQDSSPAEQRDFAITIKFSLN